jgi:hypothetical protein
MTGIWAKAADGSWQPMAASGFVNEADLHDLIEQTPSMLPLAGNPRLAVLGREVRCGRESADLIAVELDTGRPVIIEVKLAANTDRRQALTQVLGYAAYLRRLDLTGLTTVLGTARGRPSVPSIGMAVRAAVQADPDFTEEAFEVRLADALVDGRLRAVIVLDSAPADLVQLVGYLQDVTNDRLTLDLVVVSSYEVAGQRVLVPQLVEPDRSQLTAEAAGISKPATSSEIVRGAQVFEDSIDSAPAESREDLRRLCRWAAALERDGLATLYTSIGSSRWVLNPRLPRQERGMVVIWNERGAYLSPYRTVLQQLAPTTLEKLDTLVPGQIGQGNYIKAAYDSALLDLLRAAYLEAAEHSA